ncbi:MAG: transcriptional regulator [Actinophytocola sp.]|nr:transcriptional regulator [Actinophytocola sp.]
MPALQSLAARRFGVVAVSAASLIVCCALAWWQWERYSSSGGTFQNLGYVLQWPLFGLFPAFMFLRMRKLRQVAARQDSDDPGDTEDAVQPAAPTTPTEPSPASATSLRRRWLYRAPQRPVAADTVGEPDDALAEYNRYLAELNQRTDRDQTS